MALTIPINESRVLVQTPTYEVVDLLTHEEPNTIMERLADQELLAGPVVLSSTDEVPSLVIMSRIVIHYN